MIYKKKDLKLAVVGLGYVGLPLAMEFSKKKNVIGFDINKKRINELNSGTDKNLEFSYTQIKNSKNLKFTNNDKDLKFANCFIITVPTPVDSISRMYRGSMCSNFEEFFKIEV